MKEMKRILAIFLCLVMLVGVMPVSAFATEDLGGFFIPGGDKAASEDGSLGGFVIPGGKVEAEETTAPAEEETTAPAEEETTAPSTEPATEPTVATEEVEEEEAEQLDADGVTYVLAGSDFQASSHSAGASTVNGLLNQIKKAYPTMDGFLFAGDYDVNYTDSANGQKKLQQTVQAVYGTGMHEIYVQGNHDGDRLVGSNCSTSGANDAEDYGVFVINEKDYMWYNDNESTIKKTAENLESYLNAKRDAKYTKPIFVISHLPLHYSMRTRTTGNGDGKHANYIFDVLNEAGAAGLNIIFLFGHNHSHGWDDYLGGAAIFLTKGDKINIAQNSTTNFEEETLAFTYMNAGYVGYYGTSYTSSVDKTLTMTTFAITDEDVTISRYDANGTHLLKSAGVYNVEYPDSQYYSTNTATVGTPYTLELNKALVAGGGETEPGKGESGSNWVTITDPAGAATYTYTQADSITAGEEYVIVGNSHAVALMDNNGDMGTQNVTISGSTMTSTTALTEWTFSGRTSGTIYNGTRYLRYSGSSFGLNTSAGSYTLTFTDNGSNFRIWYDNTSWYGTDYYFYYNGSSWTRSSNNQSVRLYLYKDTVAPGGLYGRLEGELTYTVAVGTSSENALDVVKAGIKGYEYAGSAAPGSDVTGTEITDKLEFVLADNYDGSKPGEYDVTINYKGATLGTAKVVVTDVKITGYEVDPMEGTVGMGSADNAGTGSVITVTLENGSSYRIPVTVSMLYNGEEPVSTAEIATLTGLTVKYNGEDIAENYTLNVVGKVVNNYPTYPNEGAVKVNKTATGVDFQETGVARVELSASGVPMKKGADVVVVIDTSSSMKDNDIGDQTRIEVLSDALEQMLKQFQAKGDDGTAPDISLAIIDFNGYYPSSVRTVDRISFTDSYRQNQDYAKVFTGTNAGSYIRSVGLSARNFVAATSVNATTIASQFTNNNCKSGTNYDGALKNAYDLLAAKKAANGEEERDQYVIFLSDGAPFRYNGFNNGDSKSTYNAWNNWLTGYWASAEAFKSAYPNNTNARTYGDFYNGGNGIHPHRYAEAIKGVEGQPYSVVSYNSTGSSASLTTVDGLGATIYSIGFGLADDGNSTGKVTVATQQELIQVISSGAGYNYPNVQEADELVNAFTQIVTDIRYAAYNARFVDTMGEDYKIQLGKTVTRASDGKVITLSEAPKMEVRSYTIWTRAEYEEGKCTIDMIGDRKTNADGSYIYSVLETVTFNDAGTEAYSNKDSIGSNGSTIAAGGNILLDGVIYASTFWYNTNVKTGTNPGTVKIDTDHNGTAEYDLAAETFYWSIGNIVTNELSLSYYVHLDGSMSGKPAGSYPTNERAVLYYDNYLGNPCHKETVSPVLAWEAANVSYAFYLVNASGKPVNMDGTEVPFANRVTIVNPTLYAEVPLNVPEGQEIEPLEIVANNDILPSGYTLYDYGALYKVIINSDATGSWAITNTKAPDTTYVTGYSDKEQYTSKTVTTDADAYDYTHTTVWFAVVWEPKALPDTVVIDYGLPVDIHVLTNDMFGSFGKLVGVAKGIVTNSDNSNMTNEVRSTSANGDYGSAVVNVPDEGANESNSVIRYTLNKDNGMVMDKQDVFTYSVQYTNTTLTSNNGFYYGTLTVIPATTIYYEDDFVDLSSEKWENNGWVENGVSGWTIPEKQEITQDEDRPDDINYAFDTVIDANNVYGYDSAYAECSTYSLDQAAKATVDYDHRAKASFTFYGTGFDVISATNSDTGTIIVDVTDAATGKSVHSYVVDTYYGYVMTENPAPKDEQYDKWTCELKKDASGLYQVPVIKVSGLPYGQYEAVITAQYSPAFDPNYDSSLSTEKNSYDFYLDAIRIYDPAGVVSGEDNDVIEDAYIKDNEAFPVYQELRNNILNKSDVENGIPGAVFIDGIGETASVEDYKEYGPNNEVYLNPGQAILFTTNLGDAADKLASLQIGLKAETQTAATYYIFDAATITGSADLKTLKPATVLTATDMYYDITALAGKNIVIYNSGDGILSITNLKATFTEASGLTDILDIVDDADIENFLNALNDGETGTGSDSGTGTNLAEVIKSIVGRLKGLFGNKG